MVTKVKKGKHFPICRSFKSRRHSNTKEKQGKRRRNTLSVVI